MVDYSEEELDSYYGDEIKCLNCGELFESFGEDVCERCRPFYRVTPDRA